MLLLLLLSFTDVAVARTKPIEGASHAPREGDPPKAPAPRTDASAGVTDAALAGILEEHWTAAMAVSPVWATELGDHRFDTRLDDPSVRAAERWRKKLRSFRDRAARLTGLTEADAETRDLFVREIDDGLAVAEACQFEDWSISARDNAFVYATDLPRRHLVRTRADGDALVARMLSLPSHIEAQITNLRAGLAAGRVANRTSIDKVVAMLDAELAAPPETQALRAPEREGWPALSGADAGAVAAGYAQAVPPVRAALSRYRDLLRDELRVAARTGGKEGIGGLPNGAACYAARARQETTTELTPDAIFTLGEDEMERIHGEMQGLGKSLFGSSELATLFKRLRTDPALHFDTREAVEATAAAALARAQAAMPKVFSVLPKSACVVKPIPDHEAPYTTIAYYWPAGVQSNEPGVYYVNSWQPQTRTRFDAEVLAFHEAVPGHHFQISRAQETAALPNFRRYAGVTAYVEGWALYSERLADELGLYSTDLDRLGMLGFDSWRAARLVVDVGLHSSGWTRQDAKAYMLENTPLAENNIDNEIDRYLTWPGQALGYKVGQVELLRMRTEAQAVLGAKFSLPGFHEAVLAGGAVPLPVLEARVKRWVKAEQQR